MSSAFDVGKEYDLDQFDSLISSGYTVKIGNYFSRGWELFKENTGSFIGFLILSLMINAAAGVIPFASFLISAPLQAGFFVVIFKMLKKERVEFGDFFKGFEVFLAIVLASMLVGLFTIVGLVLLVLPGIYLAVSYSLVTMLIVEKRMHFWQAMEVSRKVVSKEWFSFFGLLILLGLLNFVGALMLLVGLLVTIPWSICIMAAAYADIIGLEPVEGSSDQEVASPELGS